MSYQQDDLLTEQEQTDLVVYVSNNIHHLSRTEAAGAKQVIDWYRVKGSLNYEQIRYLTNLRFKLQTLETFPKKDAFSA